MPVSPLAPIAECDVLIVGAGIVGLAHAAEAVSRGRSVVIIDRDSRAVGASVRNFGHCCITAQTGELLELALVARERWLHFSALAGFFSVESGAVAVARNVEELAVLEKLSGSRETGQVRMMDAASARTTLSSGDPAIVGAALLRDDLRVDPREAVGSLAAWLAAQPGVRFLWRTSYLGHDDERHDHERHDDERHDHEGHDDERHDHDGHARDDLAHTSRGSIRAGHTLVCAGHDIDYLYPELAEQHQIDRCGLQMARIEAPGGRRIAPAILTGTSMLRYPAFTETDASAALRARTDIDDPELVDIGANVMFTQRPDGSIIVGDSHRYGATIDPFQAEATTDVLLTRVREVLGVPSLRVLERWQGVYASSPQHPYLVERISPTVTAVSITSGVGMTISFGLARRVMGELFA